MAWTRSERSGVQFGPGIVTAGLGAILMIVSLFATRTARELASNLGVIASAAALITFAIHLVILYGGDDDPVFGPPYLGLYTTTVAAAVSLIGHLQLRRLRDPRP